MYVNIEPGVTNKHWHTDLWPQVSEKQYFVTALAARAKLKAWSDVDALFTSRNWLGFTRKKSPLSFQRVVDILQKNLAPTQVRGQTSDWVVWWIDGWNRCLTHRCSLTIQVLKDYVALVDDADLRISLAQKHKCHDIVINVRKNNHLTQWSCQIG